MNVLLVGSDSRENVTPDEITKFGTQKDVGGKHSDTIMILHADPRTGRAAILSIPRDLYVEIAGTGRKERINTAIQAATPEPGTAPKKINVPQTMILSTNGSRMRPRLVTWPYLRAQ